MNCFNAELPKNCHERNLISVYFQFACICFAMPNCVHCSAFRCQTFICQFSSKQYKCQNYIYTFSLKLYHVQSIIFLLKNQFNKKNQSIFVIDNKVAPILWTEIFCNVKNTYFAICSFKWHFSCDSNDILNFIKRIRWI